MFVLLRSGFGGMLSRGLGRWLDVVDVILVLLICDEVTAVQKQLETLQLLRFLRIIVVGSNYVHLKH